MESIIECLKELRDNEFSRTSHYGICANLSTLYNPKLDPHKTLELQNFIPNIIFKIYGSNLKYPIEGNYTDFFLNKNKWDISTEYGKLRLELLNKIINVLES